MWSKQPGWIRGFNHCSVCLSSWSSGLVFCEFRLIFTSINKRLRSQRLHGRKALNSILHCKIVKQQWSLFFCVLEGARVLRITNIMKSGLSKLQPWVTLHLVTALLLLKTTYRAGAQNLPKPIIEKKRTLLLLLVFLFLWITSPKHESHSRCITTGNRDLSTLQQAIELLSHRGAV